MFIRSGPIALSVGVTATATGEWRVPSPRPKVPWIVQSFIQNDESCIHNDESCIYNDEFSGGTSVARPTATLRGCAETAVRTGEGSGRVQEKDGYGQSACMCWVRVELTSAGRAGLEGG